MPDRARHQLEAALEAANLGVWEWDPAEGIVTWTPALERIYGLRPGTFDGRFESYLGFIHEDDRDAHVAAIRHAAEHRSSFSYRYRIVRPDGSERWLRGSGRALIRPDGELRLMTGVCSDVTVEMERDLIADTLRRSLLPPSLPQVPGAALASLYRPSTADVSGDFFDVFPLIDGWGAVIGDVCGKGPEAATLTSLARYTVRGAAMTTTSPPEVLQVLNQTLLTEDTERFCTALHLRFQSDASGLAVRLASGGHPPAILRRTSGAVEVVGTIGHLIGVFDEIDPIEVKLEMSPGDVLVLHTDGVTEARCGREVFGEERLRALIGSPQATTADAVIQTIEAALDDFGDGPPTDDIAILVLEAT